MAYIDRRVSPIERFSAELSMQDGKNKLMKASFYMAIYFGVILQQFIKLFLAVNVKNRIL